MIKNLIFKISFIVCVMFVFSSCVEDDLNPQSIFTDTEELDPTSPTYQLDKFCEDNYLKKYNIQFRYKLQDVGTDMDYNLIPAKYENSIDLAVLTKYLWFDVYDKIVTSDPNFMKKYGPRILHLIGSAAVNPANGTIVLGLAEGGLKVSLFYVNQMDVSSFESLNEFYFLTMHHEFAHILHQTKTYPVSFDQLSTGHYDPTSWQDRIHNVTASLGFVSTYASSEYREDFAETIAHYITDTQEEWDKLLDTASKGWEVQGQSLVEVADNDGVDGKSIILQKVEIARQWFRDSWQMDLDALRAEVQERQNTYSLEVLDELRKQVYEIPVGTESQN